jgi:hypothetical protein
MSRCDDEEPQFFGNILMDLLHLLEQLADAEF